MIFTRDNSNSFTHNRNIIKSIGVWKVTLQNLMVPNNINGTSLYNKRYILVEFSNSNSINQTNYSSSNEVSKNILFKCIKKDSNNDYLALSEAIHRRCKNLQKNDLDLPEVILLDGGKGQLNTVKKSNVLPIHQKCSYAHTMPGQ